MEEKNKYGLSRKTNVAIAGIGGVSAAQGNLWAVTAIVVIVLVAITYQYWLDRRG